jgi:hypothetical protein
MVKDWFTELNSAVKHRNINRRIFFHDVKDYDAGNGAEKVVKNAPGNPLPSQCSRSKNEPRARPRFSAIGSLNFYIIQLI